MFVGIGFDVCDFVVVCVLSVRVCVYVCWCLFFVVFVVGVVLLCAFGLCLSACVCFVVV